MGEHRGERVGGERLGSVHLPQQVEGGEALRGAGQQVRLLEEHDQNRAHPEVFRFAEVVVEVGGEALEGVGAGLLRDDAQQVGQFLRSEAHGGSAGSVLFTVIVLCELFFKVNNNSTVSVTKCGRRCLQQKGEAHHKTLAFCSS